MLIIRELMPESDADIAMLPRLPGVRRLPASGLHPFTLALGLLMLKSLPILLATGQVLAMYVFGQTADI